MEKIENWESLFLSEIKGISREEMRAIESRAYSSETTPSTLMERAGRGCAEYIRNNLEKQRVAILISSSNNGGDGLVIARDLIENDWDVTVIQLSSRPMRSPEAKKAETTLEKLNNGTLLQILPPTELEAEFTSPRSEKWRLIDIKQYNEIISECSLIVESIFGINISTPIRSPYDLYLTALAKIAPLDSESEKTLVSIDIPSGMDSNSGEWYGPEFRPTLTLTLQYSKRGLEKSGFAYHCVDIGIHSFDNFVTDDHLYAYFYRERDSESHKGDNGRLMIIGGSDEFTGAPVLSTRAALRMGVDTVRTVIPESIRDVVAGYSENFLITKVKGKYLTPKSLNQIYELALRRHETVVMGMGISNKQEVWKFVREFVKKIGTKIQLVLDADGLRAFRGHNELLYNTHAILTPHRAELRYLLGEDVPKDKQELITFLEERAKKLQCTIVLKGKVDIITNGYRTFLNYTGHPGMTVGGTGDVLAGVISSVTCFVKDPLFAAAIGTYIMGRAGERSAVKYGNSLLATDIINEIPAVIMELEGKRKKYMEMFS